MTEQAQQPAKKTTTRRRTTKKAAPAGGAHRAEGNRRVLQRQIMPLDRDFDVFALYVDPEDATLDADKYEIGVNYALGPGIKVVGGGIIWNVTGPVNGSQGQSWAAMLGMDLRF